MPTEDLWAPMTGVSVPSAGPTGMDALGSLLGDVDWGNLAMQAAILMDPKSRGIDKVGALSQLDQQQTAQQRQEQLNQFGSELAQIMDSTQNPDDLQAGVMALTRKYAEQGLPMQTMLKTAADFTRFAQNAKQQGREDTRWTQEQEDRRREMAARDAMARLRGAAPQAENYQPGSFQKLGIGSPAGRPSEAPSQAAPGKYGNALQEWISAVRTNKDIPFKSTEDFIRNVSGFDPAAARKAEAAGAGGAGGMKPSQQMTQEKLNAWRKYLAGQPLTTAEQQLIGTFKDPTAMAFRSVMANPMLPIQLMSNKTTAEDLAGMVGRARDAYVQALGQAAPAPAPGAARGPTQAGLLPGGGGSSPRAQAQGGIPAMIQNAAKNVEANKPFRMKGTKQWYVKDSDGTIRAVNPTR